MAFLEKIEDVSEDEEAETQGILSGKEKYKFYTAND